MWIVLMFTMLSLAEDEACTTALGELHTAQERANDARMAPINQARTSPTAADLANQISKVSQKWAAFEHQRSTVSELSDARQQADDSILELNNQVQDRHAIDRQIRETEADWVEASRARNAALCSLEACLATPACEGGPHKGSAKLVDQIRDLYVELAKDESEFADRFAFTVLLGRVLGAGVVDNKRGVAETRAGYLLQTLSAGTARPAIARSRVGAFLAQVDGLPRLSATNLAYARYLVVWAAQRQRTLRLMDKDIDRLIDAWYRFDTANGKLDKRQQSHMVALAQDKLIEHDAGPPSSIQGFEK